MTGSEITSPISQPSSPRRRNASITPRARSGATEKRRPPDVSDSARRETRYPGIEGSMRRPWPKTALDGDAVGVDTPCDAEAVLRLVVDDGMAARDHAARLHDLVAPSPEHLRDDRLRHLARKAGNREREEHLAAHREDVGHGIRGRDRAPGPRVVHDRWEEVH